MQIDFMTAKPRDVIARSIALHPSLFADAMRATAKTHNAARETFRAAGRRPDYQACQAATRLANACNRVADLVEGGESNAAPQIMAGGMDSWVSALNVAARLQCLSPALVADIASRADSVL